MNEAKPNKYEISTSMASSKNIEQSEAPAKVYQVEEIAQQKQELADEIEQRRQELGL